MELNEKTSLPTWAIVPIEYGDTSGIDSEDEQALGAWLETLPKDSVFKYGEDEYFTRSPAFGLPATCVDVEVFTN